LIQPLFSTFARDSQTKGLSSTISDSVTYIPVNTTEEQDVMTYVFNAPESAIDLRYEYQWEILRTALEKTKVKYGPYRMLKAQVMSEKRQAYELMNPKGEITVMYLGTTPEFEKNLIAIHIPVDKNLGGYNIFLIRGERKDEFQHISTLEDLRKFSYGLGLGWIDVDILQHNGFKVVTGSSYDGLFEMVINKRFDIFLRAAVEIIDEVEQRKTLMPELFIEDSICFFYPHPMYFWFSKTEEGKHLAARAEEGMRMMIADGTYDMIFNKYQQHKIEQLHLKTRKMFSIRNPLLGPETPFNDKRLWFDPKTYHPTNVSNGGGQ
jgi:ABC-type amino acid transport substrate-binding protein